jgi:glycerophosphoryl diester phosphodiesterase
MSEDVSLVAHRFGRSLGIDSAPSTLKRLIAGAPAHVIGLETDCVRSRDGRIALLHDSYLPVVTDLAGMSVNHDHAEILAANLLLDHGGTPSGERPMGLDELWTALEASSRPWRVQLEAKTYQNPAEAVEVVRAIDRELRERGYPNSVTIEIISFWPTACEHAARLGYTSRFIEKRPYSMADTARWAREAGVTGFVLEHAYLDSDMTRAVEQAGRTWTCGTTNEGWMVERIMNMALPPEAICTDYPLTLLGA